MRADIIHCGPSVGRAGYSSDSRRDEERISIGRALIKHLVREVVVTM